MEQLITEEEIEGIINKSKVGKTPGWIWLREIPMLKILGYTILKGKKFPSHGRSQ